MEDDSWLNIQTVGILQSPIDDELSDAMFEVPSPGKETPTLPGIDDVRDDDDASSGSEERIRLLPLSVRDQPILDSDIIGDPSEEPIIPIRVAHKTQTENTDRKLADKGSQLGSMDELHSSSGSSSTGITPRFSSLQFDWTGGTSNSVPERNSFHLAQPKKRPYVRGRSISDSGIFQTRREALSFRSPVPDSAPAANYLMRRGNSFGIQNQKNDEISEVLITLHPPIFKALDNEQSRLTALNILQGVLRTGLGPNNATKIRTAAEYIEQGILDHYGVCEYYHEKCNDVAMLLKTNAELRDRVLNKRVDIMELLNNSIGGNSLSQSSSLADLLTEDDIDIDTDTEGEGERIGLDWNEIFGMDG